MIAAQCAAALAALALRCARSSVVRENCAALLRVCFFGARASTQLIGSPVHRELLVERQI